MSEIVSEQWECIDQLNTEATKKHKRTKKPNERTKLLNEGCNKTKPILITQNGNVEKQK